MVEVCHGLSLHIWYPDDPKAMIPIDMAMAMAVAVAAAASPQPHSPQPIVKIMKSQRPRIIIVMFFYVGFFSLLVHQCQCNAFTPPHWAIVASSLTLPTLLR